MATKKKASTAVARGRRPLPDNEKKVRLTVFIKRKDLLTFKKVMERFK